MNDAPKNKLDFYKKQAKALLKAYRDGSPSAVTRVHAIIRDIDRGITLMRVQYVIAREAGTHNWDDLRSKCEAP